MDIGLGQGNKAMSPTVPENGMDSKNRGKTYQFVVSNVPKSRTMAQVAGMKVEIPADGAGQARNMPVESVIR